MLRNDRHPCRGRRARPARAGEISKPLDNLVGSGPSPFLWWARGEVAPVAPRCLDRLAVDRQMAVESALGVEAADRILALTELTETLASGWHFLTGLRLGAIAQQCGGWTQAELCAAMLEAAEALDTVN